MGTIVKKIRMVMIITENVVVKRFGTVKTNTKLLEDCKIRTKNTGKQTTFAIIPKNFF